MRVRFACGNRDIGVRVKRCLDTRPNIQIRIIKNRAEAKLPVTIAAPEVKVRPLLLRAME